MEHGAGHSSHRGRASKIRINPRAILLLLVLWSLAGAPVSRVQDAPDTATPSLSLTETALPSPTVELPTPTVEPPPSATPIEPVHVSGRYVPDEVLIRFRRHAGADAIKKCLAGAGGALKSEIEPLSVFVVKIPKGSVGASLARLSGCPETALAEPNYLVQAADTIPSDPAWSLQYGPVNIRAPQGWDISTGSPAVTIAILDTGVDLAHPDLSAKIVEGYDFVNNDSVAQDDNGHGTHVAGIAAAITDNGVGVAGISWGAHIMPVKVLDASGNGTFAGVSAGITWAADHGAHVINLSLGGNSGSTVLQDAVNYAYARGAVIVAAAGNSSANFVLYPARYPHVIAVAATDNTNAHAGFSNSGPEVDLAAPGVSIYSTWPGGYEYLSGTSMSTPFVSGLAAILRGMPGSGSPDAIAQDMESTALDLGSSGHDDLFGYGLIQMDAALRKALPPTPTAIIAATSTPGSSSGNGGRGGVNFPTFSPGSPSLAPTFTLTPSTTLTMTASPVRTQLLLTGTPTSTAELSAQAAVPSGPSLPQRVASKLGSDWPLGCGGGLLIFVGLLMAWGLTRRQQARHIGRSHLRFR